MCDERLREVAPSYTHVMPPVRAELTDAVLREVREATPLPAGRTDTTAVHALEEVVIHVDPDLGYRLFLRLLRALSVPLTEERYARDQALGEQFGYGRDHVAEGVEQLVA